MNLCITRLRHAVALAACLAGLSSASQTPAPQNPAPPPTPPKDTGKVIFSRSTDENGATTTTAGPAGAQIAAAPIAQDSERQAVTCTDFDMDVHLRPADHQIAVRALLTVRNDGKSPLAHLPLQISSTLNWERIRFQGKDSPYQVATLNSDADHTGQLHEATISLADPLAPGATLQLDVTYSGSIQSNAQRLLAIGTPSEAALHSDWDQIDSAFTGLRGFGNVVWYPVSSVPVVLGDGARLFDELGQHKLRMTGTQFRMRLSVEFPHGQAPTIALINGHPAPLTVTDPGSDEVAGVATAHSDRAIVGFDAPSLFLAIRNSHSGQNVNAWTTPDNEVNAQQWMEAAGKVTPFLQGWLGQQPRTQLTLLDLPDRRDAPFETGTLLATYLGDGPADQLQSAMVHALAHAWMQSPRAWLSEGVAHFMGTLWIAKQQGRDKALSALESGRDALALAEPESPAHGPGQPLAKAISPVYYRTKAAYVLWMLRDIAGDAPLSAALRAYTAQSAAAPQSANDSQQDQSMQPPPGTFEKLLEQAGPHHELGWFFADWVDADKGLPDLAIDSVYPTAAEAGNWFVAINVSNSGYATAEVPLTVRTYDTSLTQRVRVPARSKIVVRIVIQGKPTEVQLNDGTVPETQSGVHVTKLDQPPASSSQP